MRYLLLSVLVVCVIGVMIPNAFGWWIANVESCNDYGTWNEQTKTCTLTSDVNDFIVIKCEVFEIRNESGGYRLTDDDCLDGMTLDGNGHSVKIPTQYDFHQRAFGKALDSVIWIRAYDVTIKDLVLEGVEYSYPHGASRLLWGVGSPMTFDHDDHRVSPSTDHTVSNYYWNGYDSSDEGCLDENYDNRCDVVIPNHRGSMATELPWNIPGGWEITIEQRSDSVIEATSNSGESVIFPTPTATKNGPRIPVTCSHDSGSVFTLGTTQIICQTDEGRISEWTVTVSDTTAPSITVPSNIDAHASVPQGIVVEYPAVSATDIVELANPVSCNVGSGALFPIGENIVTCTATDTSGNIGTSTFTVTVISNVPLPVMNMPDDITVDATIDDGAYVDYPTVTATDSLGITEGPTCDVMSGDLFNVGSTTVTCTATNTAGFFATETFTILVTPFVPPPMIVNTFLPTNVDVEGSWKISNVRGDRSYVSYNTYIQGFEKKYVRTGGFMESVVLSAAVFHVTESSSSLPSQEIAEEERDRKLRNGQNNARTGYSDYSPWGFPSECEGLKEDLGLSVKIRAYCHKNDYHYSVIALGSAGDIGDDVLNFVKSINNKIDVASEAKQASTAEFSMEYDSDVALGGFVIIGITFSFFVIIVIIIAALIKKRKKTSAPIKQKPKPSQKPAESRPTSSSCSNCGNTLNPKAKFCGSCGTART